MLTALITGITGQDGSYLAELLLNKGYRVVGVVRDITSAKASILPDLLDKVELTSSDMLSQQVITEILMCYKPTEIYNLAAYSTDSGMYDDPLNVAEVNGLAVVRILEAIRAVDNRIKFCQASSREVFGEASESPQTELTLTCPRSPYGAAKAYADSMIKIYRKYYDIFACSAILFNHESPRRGLSFVTRKITNEAAKIKFGLKAELLLGNLDARRDWGFAGDYVKAMWLMLQQSEADDYIVATGELHTVREFCELVFRYLNLDYRDYVREDPEAFRPSEPIDLVGCADKAKNTLGWLPEVTFKEMVNMMVEGDIQILKRKYKKIDDANE
jgi:GDPmannose 4,6-dehydratase